MAEVVKPERPGGFLDFLPTEFLAREKMLRTVEKVFRSFGFDPIETPRIEFLKTLSGEQSDTGKNIFQVVSGVDDEPLAMPFDHTVPLARLLAANPYDAKKRTGIRLPWRRMVIGPVFRGDKPQAGRYRQFYQIDCDIAGSASMVADAEIVALIHASMTALGVERFLIRLNNRKILNGLGQLAGITARGEAPAEDILKEMMRILDKLDKIGRDEVLKALAAPPETGFDPAPNLSPEALDNIRRFLDVDGDNQAKLAACREVFSDVPLALEGLEETEQVLEWAAAMGVDPDRLVFDVSIARGLDYYTGPVMETVLLDAPQFGSVFSGGRYNGLVSRFTGQELPATGASIGADRLFAALEHLEALDRSTQTVTEVMIMRLCQDRDGDYLSLAARIRELGLNTEVCLVDDTTFKAQFNFAISRGCRYVVICGEDEFASGTVQVKNLETRQQEGMTLDGLTGYFQTQAANPV